MNVLTNNLGNRDRISSNLDGFDEWTIRERDDIQHPLPKEDALKWDRKTRLGYMIGKALPQ